MSIDPDKVFSELERQRESGELAENITTAKIVYYASTNHPGCIGRLDRETGERSVGNWRDGGFIPLTDDD